MSMCHDNLRCRAGATIRAVGPSQEDEQCSKRDRQTQNAERRLRSRGTEKALASASDSTGLSRRLRRISPEVFLEPLPVVFHRRARGLRFVQAVTEALVDDQF